MKTRSAAFQLAVTFSKDVTPEPQLLYPKKKKKGKYEASLMGFQGLNEVTPVSCNMLAQWFSKL